jgi:phasin
MANTPKKFTTVPPAPVVDEPPAVAPAAPVFEAVEATAAEMPKALETATAPIAEVQANMRKFVEKGVVQSRAAFSKAKTAASEAATAFETSLAAAKSGMLAINAKTLEAARANAEANFDFVKATFAVKSMAELVQLQSDFARKQFEAFTGQSKEIGALAQKVAADAAEPIKDQVAKTFKTAA